MSEAYRLRQAILPKEKDIALAKELDAMYLKLKSDLGEKDVKYIKRVIRFCRGAEIAGRTLIHFGFEPISLTLGTLLLAVQKIVENMEVAHNVMHGQYDFSQDPALYSQNYEWDAVVDKESWRITHNYEHHTFTNIVGKDRDYGYAVLRLSHHLKWHWSDLFQPLKCALLMLLFQWGVALHWLEGEKLIQKKKTSKDKKAYFKRVKRKALKSFFKDYVFFPLIAWPQVGKVALCNMTANLIRNLWASAVIFCGHFTKEAKNFNPSECAKETKGQWYFRQIIGSSNIKGSRLLYFMTGHLSHQIEHHLFPDIPSWRYVKIQPQIIDICQRYGIPYNTGSFPRQLASMFARIFRYSLPPRKQGTKAKAV